MITSPMTARNRVFILKPKKWRANAWAWKRWEMGSMTYGKAIARGVLRRRSAFLWALPVAIMAVAGLHPAAPVAQAMPDCQPAYAGGPLFITPDCQDPKLTAPYVDVNEPGTVTDPASGLTVHYQYVHGGFTGSNTKFAFYFPAPGAYRGWFIESTYPIVTKEGAYPGTLAFAISNGAYVVSTNNNGGVPAGGVLAPYRANAAATKFSRIEAAQIYGNNVGRPRGFIFGASGGAYQTLGAAENTRDVWDGSVPMVPGVPNSIPSFQVAQLLALRLLAPVLPQIADAEEVGGSGNPFTGLTPQQRSTLLEVSRLGFPLRGWWQYDTLNGGAFTAVERAPEALDPTYVHDFWTDPRYEGSLASVKAARIQADTSVVGLAGTTGLVLANLPAGDMLNADLTITSGPRKGTVLKIGSVSGNTIQFARGALARFSAGETNEGIMPGTTVNIDNSWLIALQYYQRHQVPTPDEYGWNQYRNAHGQPAYPQRATLIGPILDANSSGAVATGHFYGKMIMLGSAMDVQAFPWPSDWYKKKASAALGSNLEQNYRVWYMDNSDHVPPGPEVTTAADHVVSYMGECEQALLYLNDWVAKGTAPPSDTRYTIDDNTQIHLATTAAQRGGVQPVVKMTAKGAHKVDIKSGQSVDFSVAAQMPPGAGNIIGVAWDLQGSGTFPAMTTVPNPGSKLHLKNSATYTQPGTYFATVRVFSARPGAEPSSPFGLVQNIASVRVVVQ